MYQGAFVEAFDSKYGHGIKLNTEKGEWRVFGKGPKPNFASGTPVQFDAEKKGNSWAYSNLRVAASAVPPQAPSAPAPQPMPQGAATPVNPDKERDMFVTGVVGRAMGSGQFPATEIKILLLAADEAWLELQAKRSGKGPVPQAPSHDGPPAGDPRFQAPPI